MKLTLQKLKDMKPGAIFDSGTGTYPAVVNEEITWIAKRGDIHDWGIYYHRPDKSIEFIANYGDKMFTELVIKRLVPCDDEAFGMYRY